MEAMFQFCQGHIATFITLRRSKMTSLCRASVRHQSPRGGSPQQAASVRLSPRQRILQYTFAASCANLAQPQNQIFGCTFVTPAHPAMRLLEQRLLAMFRVLTSWAGQNLWPAMACHGHASRTGQPTVRAILGCLHRTCWPASVNLLIGHGRTIRLVGGRGVSLESKCWIGST